MAAPTTSGSGPTPSVPSRARRPLRDPVPIVQPGPYALQASCEFSQDYFLTSRVVLGHAEDRVLPFVGVTGQAEALVLAGGTLSHLRRDPKQASGWSFGTVPVPDAASVSTAAVVTDDSGAVFAMAAATLGGSSTLTIMTVDDTGTWTPVKGGSRSLSSVASDLRAGLTPSGQAYFWLLDASGAVSVCLRRQVGPVQLYGYTVYDDFTKMDPQQVWLLLDPTQAGGQPASGWAVVLDGSGHLNAIPQTSPEAFDTDSPISLQGSADTVSSLVWTGRPEDTTQAFPNVVFQDGTGDLWFNYATTLGEVGLDLGDTPGPGHAVAWRTDDAYAFAFLDSVGLISVITGYIDANGQQQLTDPIPLQPGFAAIYAPAADPTQETIFAVDADLTLNVLVKDANGWSLTPINTDGEELAELEAWRVQLYVTDANGCGVWGAQVQLSADRLVGLWQAGGNAILDGNTLTLTADQWGKITVAIPATELDTVVLTGQILDGSGHPVGEPLTVTPDLDVHQYLAGLAPLTGQGPEPLNGAALLAATDDDGKPLLPLLTRLPISQQLTAAPEMANALRHLTSLGFGASPQSASDVQAARLDFSQTTPAFETSTDPNAYGPLTVAHGRGVQGIGDWWDTVKHDIESVWHGIRHGAMVVTTLVTQWAADAKQWTISLIVDIGNGVQAALTWVIATMKDAIHAISGFFHALGADLEKAWDWLKRNVLDLLKKTGANAKVIEGWLDALPAELTTVLKGTEKFVDNYFAGLAHQVNGELTALATAFEKQTFGQSAALPSPTTSSTSNTQAAVSADLSKAKDIIHYASGDWLLDKFKKYLPSTDPGSAGDAGVQQVVQDLVTDAEDVITLIEDVGNLLFTTFKDMFAGQDSYSATTIADFFSGIEKVVDDGLALVDALANTVIDLTLAVIAALDNLLNYELHAVPGYLGKLLSLAGIDPTISVKHLVALIVAFPATATFDAKTSSGDLFPSTISTSRLTRSHQLTGIPDDPWACGLNLTAAFTQMIWGMNDVLVDVYVGVDPSTKAQLQVPAWCKYVDMVAPLIQVILQWPSAPDGNGKATAPFGPLAAGSGSGTLPWGIVTSVASPVAAIAQELAPADAEASQTFVTYFQPAVQMVAGVANTILASIWAWEGGNASHAGKAEGILGNFSYDFAVLGTAWVGDASDDTSILIKALLDAVGNLGAGICMLDDGISA